MKDERLTRTYAQVLLETATGDWLGILKVVNQKFAENPDLVQILEDPETPLLEREKVLRKILPKGASPKVRNLLLRLAGEGRLYLLEQIIGALETMALSGPDTQVAYVTTAVSLTAEEEKTIKEKITRRFGGPLAYRFQVDPKILGGVVVRVADKVINGSLNWKLGALRERLKSG